MEIFSQIDSISGGIWEEMTRASLHILHCPEKWWHDDRVEELQIGEILLIYHLAHEWTNSVLTGYPYFGPQKYVPYMGQNTVWQCESVPSSRQLGWRENSDDWPIGNDKLNRNKQVGFYSSTCSMLNLRSSKTTRNWKKNNKTTLSLQYPSLLSKNTSA